MQILAETLKNGGGEKQTKKNTPNFVILYTSLTEVCHR